MGYFAITTYMYLLCRYMLKYSVHYVHVHVAVTALTLKVLNTTYMYKASRVISSSTSLPDTSTVQNGYWLEAIGVYHWFEVWGCVPCRASVCSSASMSSVRCHPLPSNSQHEPTNNVTLVAALLLTPHYHQPWTSLKLHIKCCTCGRHACLSGPCNYYVHTVWVLYYTYSVGWWCILPWLIVKSNNSKLSSNCRGALHCTCTYLIQTFYFMCTLLQNKWEVWGVAKL